MIHSLLRYTIPLFLMSAASLGTPIGAAQDAGLDVGSLDGGRSDGGLPDAEIVSASDAHQSANTADSCESCASTPPGSNSFIAILVAFLLALVPGLLVVFQAIYLQSQREALSKQLDPSNNLSPQHLSGAMGRARDSTERYFGTLSIWGNLLIAGIALVVIELAVFFAVTNPRQFFPPACCSARVLDGFRYGGAGAFFSILITLGRRALRHDVTVGGVAWSIATMVAGPILAGMLALVATGSSLAAGGNFNVAAIYFVAGMSPRTVANLFEETIRRLWFSKSGTEQSPRTIPLTQLRGISTEVADRLDEEGISDLTQMAGADPFKLIRNTYFTMRQVVSWIDEAMLISTLPKAWDRLEAQGITGAIDLAWYADANVSAPDVVARTTTVAPSAEKAPALSIAQASGAAGGVPSRQPAEGENSPGSSTNTGIQTGGARGGALTDLITATGLSEAAMRDAIQRLYEDAQVQLIWVLYQLGSSEIGGMPEEKGGVK